MTQQKLPTASPVSEAREQAKAYDGLFAPTPLELDDGTTIDIPPHPNLRMLDDDRQEAYEELLFEVESYDRGPDIFIPEQKVKDSSGNEMVLPSETKQGDLLVPYRKDGKLVKPPHTVKVVIAALGEDVYARLRAGGRSAADVWRVWNQQGLNIAERQDNDSKSDGGAVAVEAVS